jgi:hypothetical protein
VVISLYIFFRFQLLPDLSASSRSFSFFRLKLLSGVFQLLPASSRSFSFFRLKLLSGFSSFFQLLQIEASSGFPASSSFFRFKLFSASSSCCSHSDPPIPPELGALAF